MNNISKRTFKILKNSQNFENLKYNYNKNNFESFDQLSLEIGTRLQKLKDIDTWGYNWIKPLGLDKTMNQMIDESEDIFHEIVREDHDLNSNNNNNNNIDLDNDNANDDGNGINEMEHRNNNINQRSNDDTHLMTENLGQMQRNNNYNDQSNSINDNNITIETSNENSNLQNMRNGNNINTASTNNNNGYILENNSNNNNNNNSEDERDLDAELSNHDLTHDLSGSSAYNEHDHAFYDDEDEYLGDQNKVTNRNVFNETSDEEDNDSDYDVGNVAIVEDGADDEMDVEREVDIIPSTSRSIIHSSFDDDIGGFVLPISKPRLNIINDEGYFMAYEDYQDDHSILEGNISKPYISRSVSISESAYNRPSAQSNRRYLDSGNLTTPTTLNSNIPNQTTGNTTADYETGGDDFNLTLEY
jgi:hypothetical protein